MKFKGGFFGKLLRLNLTTKTSSVEDIPDDILKKFVGGAALGAKLLYDEIDAGTEALGEDNKVIYTIGPITGTKAPCASRLNICTKSPLTGTVTNSLSGGYFPVEMKWAGYDAIIVEGRAEKPTYVHINNDKVQFKDASQLWGLHTLDTQLYLKEKLNDQGVRISCIGPAGENLSLMAAVINEARAAGRKGIGAVLGSKNLKAIALRGTNEVPIADEAKFKDAISAILKEFKASPMAYPVFSKTGSACATDATTAVGVFPSYNWQNNTEEEWGETIGPRAFEPYDKTANPCYRCPIACSQVRMVNKGPYAGMSTEGPEYETIYSFGSIIGVSDPAAIIAADRICDELGIDSISAGVSIAMAMELQEKGIYDATDIKDLKFGNAEAALELLRKMTYREGTGAIFADGTKKAAELIGKGSDFYALHVKGLELPAYDVRGLKAHGLNFATCYTGADHNKGYSNQEVFGLPVPYPVERLAIEGKGAITKFNQDFCGTYDVATLCEFPATLALSGTAQKLIGDLLTATTGWSYSEDEMWQLGERLNNICRMFNVRDGFSRKEDTLPERIMTEPIKYGVSKGELISQADLDFMLDEYYEARNWTKNGIPTPEKLEELGLEDTIGDLPSASI